MVLREVLHAHIPTLDRDSTVRDAVDKMDIYQFPALVIVDETRSPLAVLTEGDLCKAVAKRDSLVEMGREPAIVHATKSPTTAPCDMEIGNAFHKMISSGLTLLPVVQDEKLVGIVMRMDLMQAMLLDAVESAGNEINEN